MFNFYSDYYLLVPEIYLSVSLLMLIWLSVMFNIYNLTIGKLLSIQIGSITIFHLIIGGLLYKNSFNMCFNVFGNTIISNNVTKFFLLLVFLGLISIILLSLLFVRVNSLSVYELYIIFLIIFIGFIVLLMSNDLLSFYMGIELQSLGLYILATLKQNSIYATEAGLKYFVLGAFASCILVLGISIIYSFSGVLSFNELFLFINNLSIENEYLQGILIGAILICISLLFKVGAVPFHVWLPDVYEGVSTIITGFFAILPKIIIFLLLLKIGFFFGEIFFFEFSYILVLSSGLSIFVGSLGAIYQMTIKRLLSYSAIGHTGFLILSISLGTLQGIASTFFYIVIYFLINLNIFSILLNIQQKNGNGIIKYIYNLGYLYKNNKLLGISLVLIFFSLAGIPPFSGFFSKFFIFLAIIQKDYFFIGLYTILLSVLGSIYYLKVIRSIMFIKNIKKCFLLLDISTIGGYLISYTTVFNIISLFIIDMLYKYCFILAINFY